MQNQNITPPTASPQASSEDVRNLAQKESHSKLDTRIQEITQRIGLYEDVIKKLESKAFVTKKYVSTRLKDDKKLYAVIQKMDANDIDWRSKCLAHIREKLEVEKRELSLLGKPWRSKLHQRGKWALQATLQGGKSAATKAGKLAVAFIKNESLNYAVAQAETLLADSELPTMTEAIADTGQTLAEVGAKVAFLAGNGGGFALPPGAGAALVASGWGLGYAAAHAAVCAAAIMALEWAVRRGVRAWMNPQAPQLNPETLRELIGLVTTLKELTQQIRAKNEEEGGDSLQELEDLLKEIHTFVSKGTQPNAQQITRLQSVFTALREQYRPESLTVDVQRGREIRDALLNITRTFSQLYRT